MNEERLFAVLERFVRAQERQADSAERLCTIHEKAAEMARFSPDAMTEAIKAAKSILRPPGDDWKGSDE